MLPYSLHYFKELIETGKNLRNSPSDVLVEERTDSVPKPWEHLVSAMQIQVLTYYKALLSLKGKSSVVVLNLSMIFLTTLYTQIAQTSAKNTNFSLTYPTGKERFYC